jgi:hypothetical protein
MLISRGFFYLYEIKECSPSHETPIPRKCKGLSIAQKEMMKQEGTTFATRYHQRKQYSHLIETETNQDYSNSWNTDCLLSGVPQNMQVASSLLRQTICEEQA